MANADALKTIRMSFMCARLISYLGFISMDVFLIQDRPDAIQSVYGKQLTDYCYTLTKNC